MRDRVNDHQPRQKSSHKMNQKQEVVKYQHAELDLRRRMNEPYVHSTTKVLNGASIWSKIMEKYLM